MYCKFVVVSWFWLQRMFVGEKCMFLFFIKNNRLRSLKPLLPPTMTTTPFQAQSKSLTLRIIEVQYVFRCVWMVYAKKYPLPSNAVMSWIMHWKFEHFPNKWKMLKTKSNIRFMCVCVLCVYMNFWLVGPTVGYLVWYFDCWFSSLDVFSFSYNNRCVCVYWYGYFYRGFSSILYHTLLIFISIASSLLERQTSETKIHTHAHT